MTDCAFSRIDGNAVFLSGWNRDAVIARNTFENLGQSAIALWGRTAEMSERGWDGSALEAPLNITVDANFAHDIGQIQKQSSFLFQAVAAMNTISNNIVFNIPRCAVNFDDAYGGGALMTRNLFFNTCRESSDQCVYLVAPARCARNCDSQPTKTLTNRAPHDPYQQRRLQLVVSHALRDEHRRRKDALRNPRV